MASSSLQDTLHKTSISFDPESTAANARCDEQLHEYLKDVGELSSDSSQIGECGIQTLPVELLLLIFQELIREGKESAPKCLVFARVCKHWKDVVYNCPGVWTRVRVPTFTMDMDNDAIERQAKILSLPLSLSTTLPLRIRHTKPGSLYDCRRDLECLKYEEYPSKATYLELMQRADRYAACMMTTLVAQHERWHILEVAFDHALFLHFNQLGQQRSEKEFEIPTVIGKNLQSLDVVLVGHDWDLKSVDNFFTWIGQLGALEELMIHDDTFDFILNDNPSLTSDRLLGFPRVVFRRRNLEFEHSVKVLSHFCNSKSVALFGENWSIDSSESYDEYLLLDNDVQTSSIESDRIEALGVKELRLAEVQWSINVLERFTMPNLTVLILYSCFKGCLGKMELLGEFLDRSQCRLNRFTVRDEQFDESDILPFLRMLALKQIPEVDFCRLRKPLFSKENIDVGGPDVERLDLDGMNFKAWTETIELYSLDDDLHEMETYSWGWKETTDDDSVVFICEDGKIIHC